MSTDDDVLRVPFGAPLGEVARLAQKQPRKRKPKSSIRTVTERTPRPAKEATMTDMNKSTSVPDDLSKGDKTKQEQALARPSAFSESMSQHSGEFATAFSYAAGAVAGGLVVIGIAALVQKGVNAAFGGTDATPTDAA